MTRRRRVAVAVFAALLSPAVLGSQSASAAPPGNAPAFAIIFLVAPTSFESFMRVPAFRQLARAGGAGLLATDENYRSNPADVYESIGAGAPPGAATPGLLARSLRAAGVQPCLYTAAGRASPIRRMFGTLSTLSCLSPGFTTIIPPRLSEPRHRFTVVDMTNISIDQAGRAIGSIAPRLIAGTLVMVVSPYPSPAMNRVGDEVTPIVMAVRRRGGILPTNGPLRSLRSNTTRQDGLVANIDLATTVLGFFRVKAPAAMDGGRISTAGDEAPFALHRKHLDQRRIRLPIQLFEVALVSALGLVAIVSLLVLRLRGRLPGAFAAGLRFLALVAVAMMIPIAMAGWLPRLTYAIVFAWLIGSSLLLASLSLVWRRHRPLAPFIFLGGLGVAVIALDLILGSPGLRVPLLGGTMFDGVRFYGLPNAFEDTLLASALFVAFRTRPISGAVLLFACGLLAGLPYLGADLGGSLTMFVASGLWWQLRGRGRLGLRELATAAVVTVAGLALVLLASRFLAGGSPTHVTHFVQQSGGRLSRVLSEIGHRLGVGARQAARAPAALIPLLGLPAALWVTLAGPAPVGESLDVERGWRDVIVVMLVSGMIAFFVNDTGLAAAAPTFLYAMAAITYPCLLPRAQRSANEPSTVSSIA